MVETGQASSTTILDRSGANDTTATIDISALSETPRRRRPRVLLGITGSVAAVKGPEIAVRLRQEANVDVKVLLTQGGHNFWTKAREYDSHYWNELETCSIPGTAAPKVQKPEDEKGGRGDAIHVHYAEDEWKGWSKLGDPVLHIDLRDWADILLIAPLSAHTLAKLAHGLCDDTLSCVVRAWDFGHGIRPGKPILLAPAMNTAMWQHPLTRQQLDTFERFWASPNEPNRMYLVAPQVKTLACGEVGNGALATVDDILGAVETVMRKLQPE